MKKILLKATLPFVFFLFTYTGNAQEYTFKNYNWDEKLTAVEIPEKYKTLNEVVLERDIKIELLNDKGAAKQFYLFHEKVAVNTDDAIERNNRVYIPHTGNENLLEKKVRVFLKNGKVVTLNNNDIKEEIDEERNIKYNYFAITGLEKGAIIEKFFILEEVPDLDGNTVKIQDEYVIAKMSFELIYPEHLIFKTKTYNGLKDVTTDEEKYESKKVITLTENDIPALEKNEEYSNRTAALKMIRYKLDENLYNGSKNLYNYKTFASNIFDRLHQPLDKKDTKAISEFCKTIASSKETKELIWNIEDKVKKTITYDRYIDNKNTISEVIKTKQANQFDILRLYIAVFDYFKIENNTVLTSERFGIPFDKDFESYENLNELLFYFPTVDKYITPTEVEYRIPLFPAQLGNNNGLFIKSKEFAGVKMAVSEIKFIALPGTELTTDIMEITIDLSKDIENPTVSSEFSYGGYSAMNLQPIKDYVSNDDYKTIFNSVIENYTNKKENENFKTANEGTANVGKNPFLLEFKYAGNELVQKAGNNYLLSLGLVIGKQMELYQQNKRLLPVELQYPHAYTRKIKVILPPNVDTKNMDKINMDKSLVLNNKTEAQFKSTYTKTENQLTIENTEFYNIVNYPLEKFEEYKTVINAAADFNKLVLILTQK
ncbi:DUF3857 domain-containing protein [Flavobacterium limnosediminis]|uniref:DUF3857 domain-containing protein n=1 Tax=Flavobacterium limnosediminis TaxID=1401027 RepID=UPI00041AD9AD|nr:DUF3857 domain-containing protein [Flavobacterium limnosediminis]